MALEIAVTDTGIGIAADNQERIFDGFTQAEASTTRRFGGTGLGLAICKQLTAMMGGSIGVESVQGAGSTFTVVFDFPLTEAPVLAPLAPPPPTAAAADGSQGRLRVLLVEDHPVNRQVVQLMLGEQVDLDMAENGADGVQALEAASYDLILMDMQMPVMDGLVAARAMRARGDVTVPIVAMTANAFAEDRAACLEAGMNDHIAKPVNPAALYDILMRWLPPRVARR
jgi:CheY-like chemotaxis protein